MANSGINTFNYIRNNASRQYKDIVPVATKDNIQSLGNILLNDSYQPQLNEFVNSLINRIALTIIRNKTFNNPLSILKKGSTPLGTDIQDIYENPAQAKPYEYSDSAMAQLLKITDPDTHVAYYRVNRRDKYTKTITREGLQGAFVSWDKFEEFISNITQSLYSGNYIDEFKYTKALVDSVYDNNKVIVETVTKPTDEATSKAFLKKCRYLYNAMSFPSEDYNAYSKFRTDGKKITTWTDKDRVVLMVRADVMAEVDVDALASSFNLDKADFMGRVIQVDKFENDSILGIICDEAFFQIYDNVFRFDEFYNANVMAWNEYLHAWNTFAVCPFANAVVLATTEPLPATNISFGTETVTINAVGEVEGLEITVTPTGATTDISYVSENEEVFTVSKVNNLNSRLTATGVGNAKLNAYTDNGLSTSVNVVVTG